MTLPIRIRPPTAEDLPVIVNSWLLSARDEGTCSLMTDDVYYAIHRPRVTGLLARCTTRVACNPDDAWQVYGWLCSEPGVLHYGYTKATFRRCGVFDRLFGAAGLHGSIATATGYKWAPLTAKYALRFDPRRGM